MRVMIRIGEAVVAMSAAWVIILVAIAQYHEWKERRLWAKCQEAVRFRQGRLPSYVGLRIAKHGGKL